eukprot:scaffold32979_cov54-Phaeocystis_antarctica.AAC.2
MSMGMASGRGEMRMTPTGRRQRGELDDVIKISFALFCTRRRRRSPRALRRSKYARYAMYGLARPGTGRGPAGRGAAAEPRAWFTVLTASQTR